MLKVIHMKILCYISYSYIFIQCLEFIVHISFKYIYTCILVRKESLCVFHTIRLGECQKHNWFFLLMYLLPVTLQQQQHSTRSRTTASVLRTPSRWDAMVNCKLKPKYKKIYLLEIIVLQKLLMFFNLDLLLIQMIQCLQPIYVNGAYSMINHTR